MIAKFGVMTIVVMGVSGGCSDMARLIDGDELKKKAHWMEMLDNDGIPFDVQAVSVSSIDLAPTVDAVEVVRCKDCKYRGELVCPMFNEEYMSYDDDGYFETDIVEIDNTEDDAFCSVGMRREGD